MKIFDFCLVSVFCSVQHVVRLRWDELSSNERRDFTNVAIGLLPEVAGPCEVWALKSQTAALIAEVSRFLVFIMLLIGSMLHNKSYINISAADSPQRRSKSLAGASSIASLPFRQWSSPSISIVCNL